MRTYSFSLVGARLAYLLTITRVDETVIRITNYARSITIGGETWLPGDGLEIGDNTETNTGDIPNLTFKVTTKTGGTFDNSDIKNRLFERAEATLEITNAANPVAKDYEFSGILKGDVTYDIAGNAQFEILNKFGLQRDIFVRKYTIEDDVDFGDPRRSKVPTFPTVDPTSDDLADVARNETLALTERRRFRYAGAGNPSDYHNVYWEVTTAGATGGTAPASPSDTLDATVSDGSVVFTVRNAYARAFQVASIIDSRHITISVTDPRAVGDDTWFAPGLLVMRSGLLLNRGSDIDAWDGISQIELVVPFANLLEVGDWGEIAPDYDQTLDMLVEKYFDYKNNYRGFPHVTGARVSTSTFIPGTTVDTPDDGFGSGGGDGGGGSGGGDGGSGLAVEFAAGST